MVPRPRRDRRGAHDKVSLPRRSDGRPAQGPLIAVALDGRKVHDVASKLALLSVDSDASRNPVRSVPVDLRATAADVVLGLRLRHPALAALELLGVLAGPPHRSAQPCGSGAAGVAGIAIGTAVSLLALAPPLALGPRGAPRALGTCWREALGSHVALLTGLPLHALVALVPRRPLRPCLSLTTLRAAGSDLALGPHRPLGTHRPRGARGTLEPGDSPLARQARPPGEPRPARVAARPSASLVPERAACAAGPEAARLASRDGDGGLHRVVQLLVEVALQDYELRELLLEGGHLVDDAPSTRIVLAI
mmetsp:Transcript_10577/g.20897  ORF Transcript_10577/g.20897 Transcript_10577/m.20897 type:complete len:307 (-) Transcript_10577:197-1117(-)